MTTEDKVTWNALLLDACIPSLMKEHQGKFVSFDHGRVLFSDNLQEAREQGSALFGEDSGFVTRKISSNIDVFGCLSEV